MATFRRTVTVTPVDRAWFEECAGLVLDVVESSRSYGNEILLADGTPVPALRLLKGRHLRPGARYEVSSPDDAGNTDPVGTLTIREWRRSGVIAVEQRMALDEMSGRLTVRLSHPERPGKLNAAITLRSPEGGALRRGSGRVKADPAAWWAAAAIRPGAPPAARPPVVARAKHLLGQARLTLTPHTTDEGVWLVGVTLTVRGRLLMRPVAALALFLCQVPVRRAFREAVDTAAAGWNEMLSEGFPGREEFRADVAKALST